MGEIRNGIGGEVLHQHTPSTVRGRRTVPFSQDMCTTTETMEQNRWIWLLLDLIEQPFDLCVQFRQAGLNGLPDDFQIDLEVAV